MSATTSAIKGQAIKGGLILLVLLAVTIIGFSLLRYFTNKANYEKGHQAYLLADCQTAIPLFKKIINDSRLLDPGNYSQPAQFEKDECQAFQNASNLELDGDLSSALVTFLDFMTQNVNSPLVEAARARITGLFQIEKIPLLAGETSCKQTGSLLEKNLIPNQETNLPLFYLACGQYYEENDQPKFASAMYQWILTSYPDNPASISAETALLENPLTCQESETLRQSIIANRADFMQRLYYGCGMKYEENSNFVEARKMYETFLSLYPEHALAKDVESALARTIVAQAKASGAGEISQPESSGSTESGSVKIVIQNDSPDRLRITFSGPNSQVEELEACPTCISYGLGQKPMYCPELGPIGQYTLPPGVYDIVIESISDEETVPWAGNWNLIDGNEYFRCIVMTTVLQ